MQVFDVYYANVKYVDDKNMSKNFSNKGSNK